MHRLATILISLIAFAFSAYAGFDMVSRYSPEFWEWLVLGFSMVCSITVLTFALRTRPDGETLLSAWIRMKKAEYRKRAKDIEGSP